MYEFPFKFSVIPQNYICFSMIGAIRTHVMWICGFSVFFLISCPPRGIMSILMPSFSVFFESALIWTSNLHQSLFFWKVGGGRRKRWYLGIITKNSPEPLFLSTTAFRDSHSPSLRSLRRQMTKGKVEGLSLYSFSTTQRRLFVRDTPNKDGVVAAGSGKPAGSFRTCCSRF